MSREPDAGKIGIQARNKGLTRRGSILYAARVCQNLFTKLKTVKTIELQKDTALQLSPLKSPE
jgi:hypothetical protein